MKKLILCLLLFTGAFSSSFANKPHPVGVSFQVFYDELSPYGMWVDNPTYGYVWVPSVEVGFRPYASEGYWVFTDAGWTWVSYYPWGWAPFHYGRWNYDPYYGYVWIPGNEWGPAWVSWRYCDGYYGWTALGPGISWSVGYSTWNPPAERWIFVHEGDFGRRNINNYYINQSTNVTIINKTTVINNTVVNRERNETYIAGPRSADVRKATGKDFNPIPVKDNPQHSIKVDNNQVSAFRPKIENAGDRKVAPAKVYTANEAKPMMEKKSFGGKPAGSVGDKQPVSSPADGKGNIPNNPARERKDVPNNKVPTREPTGVSQPQKQQIPQHVVPVEKPREERKMERVVPQQGNPQQTAPERKEQMRQFERPQQNMEPRHVNPQQDQPQKRDFQPANPAPGKPQQFNEPQRRMEPQQPMQREPQNPGFQHPQQSNPRPVEPRMNPQPMQPQSNPRQIEPRMNPQPMQPHNNPSPQPFQQPSGGHRPH